VKTETADFPQVLQINYAASKLAEALFEAQCEAFGPASGSFRHLQPDVKQSYIEASASILRLLKPRTHYEFISPDVIARVARLMFHVVPPA
jgi:hypothetical protein